MKKMILVAAAALFATTASAAIKSSSHDFTAAGGGSSCAYCHMPHNSPYTSTTAPGAPLWARNIDYTATYTVYASSVTGHQVPANPPAPGSRICLSCHDGTQAISTVFQASGTGTKNAGTSAIGVMSATSPALVGTDLSNDHPVSVSYTTANAAIFGLADPATLATTAFSLPSGKVECVSCHNAHNAAGVASAYPTRQFMVAYSGDFCVACHATK
ncbi:MAG TPA: hypothetical protein VF841_10785 [Anaeromyxobacter sp.]